MAEEKETGPATTPGDTAEQGAVPEHEHIDDEVVEEAAKEAEQLLLTDMAQYMSQFARSFEASARRWELVVYPTMLAFVVLAAYGFFLIYKLTNDIGHIVGQMEAISISMVNINQNFSSTTNNMNTVSRNMVKMTGYMEQMSHDIKEQNAAMGAIVISMREMNQSIDSMSYTMYHMRYDTQTMGRNIENVSGPMRFMNNFMPW
ncbi:MAG TPA: methyl-accepting chemotaxis protein [Gammaproteobacteria bacterium]|nr:methyl-accepting chemotaxis protein [Gammaproteobacteria bacterium]